MTAKEQADYEEGKNWGYRNPRKTVLWPKSDAWCAGVRAGKAEYWKEYQEEQKHLRARARALDEWRKAWGYSTKDD